MLLRQSFACVAQGSAWCAGERDAIRRFLHPNQQVGPNSWVSEALGQPTWVVPLVTTMALRKDTWRSVSWTPFGRSRSRSVDVFPAWLLGIGSVDRGGSGLGCSLSPSSHTCEYNSSVEIPYTVMGPGSIQTSFFFYFFSLIIRDGIAARAHAGRRPPADSGPGSACAASSGSIPPVSEDVRLRSRSHCLSDPRSHRLLTAVQC
jgi:hypothetical protein